MKVTVVRDEHGEMTGSVIGKLEERNGTLGVWSSSHDDPRFVAGVVAGPGQRFEEQEVPDELMDLVKSGDAPAFHARLAAFLSR
jgi:hypothetical protein